MLRTHVCSSIFTQMHEQHLRCSSSFIEGFFYFVSTFPSYSVKPHALVCNQVVQCWFIISVSAYYFLVWHHSHFESLLHSPSVTWYFNNKQEYFKIMLKLWFFTGGNTVLPGHIMQCPEMSLSVTLWGMSRGQGWSEHPILPGTHHHREQSGPECLSICWDTPGEGYLCFYIYSSTRLFSSLVTFQISVSKIREYFFTTCLKIPNSINVTAL